MTDFQSRSSRVGRGYEQQVVEWLTSEGFTITGRNVRHESGIQLDIDAIDPNGERVGIECKASDDMAPEASRGMRRSDNRWKVFGYLYVLSRWRRRGGVLRYMLFTSDMPDVGEEQRRFLDLAEAVGDITIIHLPYTQRVEPGTETVNVIVSQDGAA